MNSKKILSTVLAAMIATTNMYSATKHSYFGVAIGKLSYDEITGDGDTFYSLDSKTLYEGTTSPWLFGLESLIGGNSDTFLVNLGINAGGAVKFDGGKKDIKLYAILGYGLQVLDIENSEDNSYAGKGVYYGLGATYDISQDFAVHLTYRKHKNDLTSDGEDDPLDGLEYDLGETNFSFSIKF